MSRAEETLTELQAWLKEQTSARRAKGEKFSLHKKELYETHFIAQALMAQETLDWLETKRSGNE